MLPNSTNFFHSFYIKSGTITWPNSAYPSAQLGNLWIVVSKAFIDESLSVTCFTIFARRNSTI